MSATSPPQWPVRTSGLSYKFLELVRAYQTLQGGVLVARTLVCRVGPADVFVFVRSGRTSAEADAAS